MMKLFASLKTGYLIVFILVLAVGGVILSSLKLYSVQKRDMLQQFSWRPFSMAQRGASSFTSFFTDLIERLDTSYLKILENKARVLDDIQFSEALQNLYFIISPKQVTYLGVLDSRGVIKHWEPQSPEFMGKKILPQEDFIKVISTQTVAISGMLDLPNGSEAVAVTVPTHLISGDYAALVAIIEKDILREMLKQSLKLSPHSPIWLVDYQGKILIHENQQFEGMNIFDPTFLKKSIYGKMSTQLFQAQTRGEAGFGHYVQDDIYHIVAYVPLKIGNLKWSLGLSTSFFEMTSLIKRGLYFTLVVIITFIFILALGSFFVMDINKKRIFAEEESNLHKARWKLEQEKRASEERYAALYNGANDAIFVLDRDKRDKIVIMEANPRGQEITGLNIGELKGNPFISLFPEGFQEEIQRGLELVKDKGLFNLSVLPLKTKSGKIKQVDINCSMVNYEQGQVYLCLVRDITERKELEEQVLQMDKMASLGELSAGLVHEIRNPLTGIKANAQLLQRFMRKDDEKLALVNDLLSATDKLADIVTRISNFAKSRTPDYIKIDINEVLESSIKLVQTPLRKQKIELKLELGENLPWLFIDPLQIQQVCINILTNAWQAMPNGGILTISTSHAKEQNLSGSEAITIRISDTGEGINHENLGKIFNPSFTTKNDGTGLGLAISQKIIKQHLGEIRVYSQLDKGTQVEVELPVECDKIKQNG